MKDKKKQVASKMESKTYSHLRCGKCNRFGHGHDKCTTDKYGTKRNSDMLNSSKNREAVAKGKASEAYDRRFDI